MKDVNANTCPNLFNLLTLPEVIDDNTIIVDQDSGEPIDLCKLILAAKRELLK